jgi:hypothetical protein
MDERTRDAFRAWRSDPGDRESFDQWWHSFLRSEGLEPFEARIVASGLFDDSGVQDEAGNKIWIHKASTVNMVQVEPQGARRYSNVDTEKGLLSLHSTEPFLLATAPVGNAEWSHVTGDTSGGGTFGAATVTWNRAAGWCEQMKLRLPTHAMWVEAREAGLITKRNTGPEFLQDFFNPLTDPKAQLPLNPLIAVGDTDYSSSLWTDGSPADLVFNDFLMSRALEDDYEEVVDRISAYGLNVAVNAEPQVVTYHDRSGNPRQIVERAGPFPEGAPSPSDDTPPNSADSVPIEQQSQSASEDPEFLGGLSAAGLLDSADFELSGGEFVLPLFYDDTVNLPLGARAAASHDPSNGYRIREVWGRRGRPKIRPVWR